MWVSVQLGLAAMLIAVSLGVPLGLTAAYYQGRWLDTALVSLTLFFLSTPVFISAPFLILLFAVQLGLLPVSGWDGLFSASIVMPALVMGLPGVAGVVRLTRASAIDVLGQDYVRTARAKGLTEATVQARHVLRNALTPLITVLGLSLATLVEGAFITETIFGIPGHRQAGGGVHLQPRLPGHHGAGAHRGLRFRGGEHGRRHPLRLPRPEDAAGVGGVWRTLIRGRSQTLNDAAQPEEERRSRGPWVRAALQLLRRPKAVFGIAVILLLYGGGHARAGAGALRFRRPGPAGGARGAQAPTTCSARTSWGATC